MLVAVGAIALARLQDLLHVDVRPGLFDLSLLFLLVHFIRLLVSAEVKELITPLVVALPSLEVRYIVTDFPAEV